MLSQATPPSQNSDLYYPVPDKEDSSNNDTPASNPHAKAASKHHSLPNEDSDGLDGSFVKSGKDTFQTYLQIDDGLNHSVLRLFHPDRAISKVSGLERSSLVTQ